MTLAGREPTVGTPICFRCVRPAEQIGEYIDAAADHNRELAVIQLSPTEWMRSEEGTYNPQTNRFCCTECYIQIGMPVGQNHTRWRAP